MSQNQNGISSHFSNEKIQAKKIRLNCHPEASVYYGILCCVEWTYSDFRVGGRSVVPETDTREEEEEDHLASFSVFSVFFIVFILRQRSDVVTDDMRKSSATTPNTEENTMLLRQTELSDSAERGTAKGTNGAVRSNRIYHRKLKYYIWCLIDVILKIE